MKFQFNEKTAVLLLLILGGGAILAFKLLGYSYITGMVGAGELAQTLIANDRSVRDCLKIKTFHPNYPPVGQIQSMCIHDYARIAKDPTACALLIPSDYGWSCLGVATEDEPCVFDFKDPPMVGGNGIHVPMSECESGTQEVRSNECCLIANEVFLKDQGSCDSLNLPPEFKDQCFHRMGRVQKDASYCASVQNENIRTSCEVAVKALIKQDQ